MKKVYFLFVFLCMLSVSSFAQDGAKESYVILEVTEVPKGSFGPATLKIYYPDGTVEDYGKDKELDLPKGIGYNAGNVVKAFNHLAGKGYAFVNGVLCPEPLSGGLRVVITNYIFKKDH